LEAVQTAEAILERVAADDSSNSEAALAWSGCCLQRANIEFQLGNQGHALDMSRKAAAVRTMILNRERFTAAKGQTQVYVAESQAQLGRIHLARDERTFAAKAFEQAIAHWRTEQSIRALEPFDSYLFALTTAQLATLSLTTDLGLLAEARRLIIDLENRGELTEYQLELLDFIDEVLASPIAAND
jgi:tetratricopeptide (TPR) repeat protein